MSHIGATLNSHSKRGDRRCHTTVIHLAYDASIYWGTT